MANGEALLVHITLILMFWALSLAFFYYSQGRPNGGVTKICIRAVGIMLVVVAAVILATIYESAVTAEVGLLGIVAGYLFETTTGNTNESQTPVGVFPETMQK